MNKTKSKLNFKQIKEKVLFEIKKNHLNIFYQFKEYLSLSYFLLEQKSLCFLDHSNLRNLLLLYYFDKYLPFDLKYKLSDKRYNKCLRDSYIIFWDNLYKIPTKILIKLFKKCEKRLIMEKEELKEYNKFGNIVTIYRACYPKDILRPSWAIVKPIWILAYYPKKKIYKSKIRKKDIYCYIKEKGETEAIINPYKLLNKPKCEKMIKNKQTKSK